MPTAGRRVLLPDGKRALGSTGKRLLFNASGECPTCCEDFSCCACGDCCFSDNTTADVSYDLTNVTSSSGSGFDDAWLTKSTAGIPFALCNTADVTRWFQAGVPYNTLFVNRLCSLNTWGVGTPGPDETTDTGELDLYVVDINSGGSSEDCCGFSAEAANIVIDHYHRDSAEDEFPVDVTSSKSGTGSASITINNNGCCKDSGSACVETAGNCDGTCDEEPP